MAVVCLSFPLIDALMEAIWGSWENDEPDMDSDLWKQLPRDDLENVLLWLPPSCMASFRSVSKSWQKFLTSSYFQQSSAALFSFNWEDSICLCSPGVVNPVPIGGVQVLSFESFLPEGYRQNPRFFSNGALLGVAVTTQTPPMELSICVFNPVDRTWTDLPVSVSERVMSPSEWSVQIVTREDHFQVFLYLTRRRRRSYEYGFHVFSSCHGTWEAISWKPDDGMYTNNSRLSYSLEHFDVSQEFLYARRSLEEYFWVERLDDIDYKAGFKVLRFSSKDGQYVSTLPSLPEERVDSDDVYYEEGFQVVSDQKGTVYWIADRCDIWRLDESLGQWVNVANLPRALEDQMVPPGWDLAYEVPSESQYVLKSVQVFGNVMLFVATHHAGEEWHGNNKVVWMFGFHLLEGSWMYFGGPFDETITSSTFLGFGPWLSQFGDF